MVLLMPGFASAFCHFQRAMKLDGFWREHFYCWLALLRYAPLALLVTLLVPPAISCEALHCHRQGTSLPWHRRKMWELRTWGRGLWLGVGVVFLLSFQEFEIAATWNLRSWPVALFDAQVGGLALRESLRLAVLPLFIQVAFIALLVCSLRPASHGNDRGGMNTQRSWLAPLVLLISFFVHSIFPCVAIGGGGFSAGMFSLLLTWPGLAALAQWREIGNSLGIAIAATLIAWPLSGWIERRISRRWPLVLPGLLGSLLCSLLLVSLLQMPPLRLLRETIFPTVLALALVQLPFAILLRYGIEVTGNHAALHMAHISNGRRALWQLDGWPRLCSLLLLFCFAYGDFTANSLLAPPQFTSVSVRLLNLLHYGRSDTLVVMFTLAYTVPLVIVLLTMHLARFYPRRRAS